MGENGEKLKFALWGAGVLAVFLFHLAALVGAGASGEGNGARVWSILLLIAAPLGVVLLIGGGLARTAERERPEADGGGPESNVDR